MRLIFHCAKNAREDSLKERLPSDASSPICHSRTGIQKFSKIGIASGTDGHAEHPVHESTFERANSSVNKARPSNYRRPFVKSSIPGAVAVEIAGNRRNAR